MSEPELRIETDGSVLILTMSRPERRNAMTRALGEAIAAALDDLDQRPDLSVGILTGAGGTFCSGMDLKAFLAGERPTIPGRGFGGLTERPPAKPLIAAVEGYAVAGGFELVLACDLVVRPPTPSSGSQRCVGASWPGAGGCCGFPSACPKESPSS